MLNMDSKSASKSGANRRPSQETSVSPSFRIGGYILSMASDIGALEECLALERGSGNGAPIPGSEGILSPPAVPYCEFMTVRSPDGRLQAVCRLMRLDRMHVPGNPLKTARLRRTPLITAMRYTREGILEMGTAVFAKGSDQDHLARLIWTGTVRYMERNGLGFVLGREFLPLTSGHSGDWENLMEAHGLHPDLEVETRFPPATGLRAPAMPATRQDPTLSLPAGLREALRRGIRLACEPILDAATGCHEVTWVASRGMLEAGEADDWRGLTPPA